MSDNVVQALEVRTARDDARSGNGAGQFFENLKIDGECLVPDPMCRLRAGHYSRRTVSMSRAHLSRFAVRDHGLRRARIVTAWSAAGSAGLALAAAIALVPATAWPASSQVTGSDNRAGTDNGSGGDNGAAGDDGGAPAGGPTPTAHRSPSRTNRPRPRRTTTAPRLAPPTVPPATSGNGGQHATSGGS